MGLNDDTARFLRHLRSSGVRFTETLTIGHQAIYMDSAEYAGHLAAQGAQPPTDAVFADEFFRALGVEAMVIADVSAYEGATLLHDFNLPLPPEQRRQFDCVFDGGALEHVFNFPQALKTCMELTRRGGHLVIAAPGNNFFGHGFYQLSPELFFRALAPENGFEIELMLTCEAGRWYAIADPAAIGSRVELLTSEPLHFFLSARRVSEVEPFRIWPQQSDYTTSWIQPSTAARTTLKDTIVARSAPLRRLQRVWRQSKQRRRCSLSNSAFFQPVTLPP